MVKYVNLFKLLKDSQKLIKVKYLFLSLIIITLDFISKKIILNKFHVYEIYSLNPFLNIVYIQNFGISFGLFENKSYILRWFLIFFISIICFIFFIYIFYQKNINKENILAYLFIFSGGIGNLIDRILYGFVIDFIDFYILNFHWPTFNIADSFISIGIFLLILNKRCLCSV
ncbi:MAG: signal peptidase II [Arsenophonus sp.]|nr:MAG: signal peptidase II [Arsenophonus sp.]